SYEGRVWKLDRALMTLRPHGETPPPFWLAGGTQEILELVGTCADGWISYIPGASPNPESFGQQVATIREHAERAGRDPYKIAIGGAIMCVLADDEGQLDALRDNVLLRWITMMAVTNSNLFKVHGLVHPMGEDW